MRLRPRTLAGQLLLLLLLALVITHVVVVAMLVQLRTDDEIHPLSIREMEWRIPATYRVLTTHTATANTLAAELSAPESRLRLIPADKVPTVQMDAQETSVAQRIQQKLKLPPNAKVTVDLQAVPVAPEPYWNAQHWVSDTDNKNWTLDIYIPLPDGRTLHNRSTPSMMHGHWGRLLSFSIPVGLLPIIVIALIFGKRLMRPLRALTHAAKRISRGERMPAIAVEGPADMRELIETFNDMQGRLTRYVGDRTRMIAALGHDLRTPLTSLRIRAELVDSPALRDAMVETIDEMSVMTEEILQFAQDDAALEATQTINVNNFLNELVQSQRLMGHDVKGTIHLSDMSYDCRPVHLKRALNNLIDNATRYGPVQLHAFVSSTTHELKIQIDDQGPGIPPDQLEQVFEPFVRLDVTRNRDTHAGTGLGLAIARSCIRAHGGDVQLHNQHQGGLRATISLPL